MSNQTNVLILQCGVVDDPTSKQVGGYTVAQFSVANSRGFGDKTKTYYFNVEAWGKVGETVMNYLRKGTQIVMEGELKQETWIDKDAGKKRSAVKINCRAFSFGQGNKKPEGQQSTPAPVQQDSALPFNDDDIPF